MTAALALVLGLSAAQAERYCVYTCRYTCRNNYANQYSHYCHSSQSSAM